MLIVYLNLNMISFFTSPQEMAINSYDIVSTLQALGMMKYWKGKHIILKKQVRSISQFNIVCLCAYASKILKCAKFTCYLFKSSAGIRITQDVSTCYFISFLSSFLLRELL